MSFDAIKFGYRGVAVCEGSRGVATSAPSVLLLDSRLISEILGINSQKTHGSWLFVMPWT